MNNINDHMKKLRNAYESASIETLEDASNEVVPIIQALTPVKNGFLRKSITRSEVIKGNDGYSVKVGSSLEYARPVEEGHSQEVGKYIPAIGKKLVKSFVPGHHMIRDGLTIEENKLSSIFKEKLRNKMR